MPRPKQCRRVGFLPKVTFYKPAGIPLAALQQVNLTVDELEAMRLTSIEGLYQADAAEKMNISRQTIGRILESAYKKITDALVNGKAISIEGGPVELHKIPQGAAVPFRFRRGFGRGGRGGRGRGRGRFGKGPTG